MDAALMDMRSLFGGMPWEEVVWVLIRLTTVLAIGRLALALLAKRGTAATRHVVAVVALGAAVAMPVASLTLPAGPEVIVPDELAAAVPILSRVVASEPASGRASAQPATAATDRSAAGIQLTTRTASHPDVPLAMPERWAIVLWSLMVAVAAGLLVRVAVSVGTARKLVRDAMPFTDDRLRDDLERARNLLGIRRPIALLTSGRVSVPMVAGLVRPVLLLPADARTWCNARRHAVLTHELAHIRRRDGLTLLFIRVASAILWFHPLAWALARAARRECEQACDDVVLATGIPASDYADHLLSIAWQRRRVPELALAFARRTNLEKRLRALLCAGAPRGPASRRAIAAIACLALVILIPLASLRVVAAPAPGAPREHEVSRVAHREVVARYGSLVSVQSKDRDAWKSVGLALLRSGEPNLSAAAFERQYEIDGCPGALYNWACALAVAGDRTGALSMLERAIHEGTGTGEMIATDPDLIGLRGDREYRRLHALAADLNAPGVDPR